MKVYLLHHEYELDGSDETKLIGVYACEEDAARAAERARSLPGFRDHPEDFSISSYEVGRDGWTAGFESLRPQPRASDRAA